MDLSFTAAIIVILLVAWFFRNAVKATAKTAEEEIPVVLTATLKTAGIAARQLESNAYILATENELEIRRRTADVMTELKQLKNTPSAKELYNSLNN